MNISAVNSGTVKFVRATYVGEDINEDGKYRPENDANGDGKIDRYVLPEPPRTPKTKIISSNNKVEIYWDNTAVESIDTISRKKDFLMIQRTTSDSRL